MKLLSEEDLYEKGIRYSRSHRHRLIKAGLFPRPVKRAPGSRNAWVDTEMDDYIARLIAERDAERAAE